MRYPFGKYDQLFVPEFNAGAMENAGCVTFLEDYVFRSRVTRSAYERRAETILHEMAHMWFGDLVTMRWWDDLWLNESFATFASRALPGRGHPSTPRRGRRSRNVEKSWAYRQDQLPSTHPIAADIPDLQAVEVNFDGITYAKGASVLKQLVAYVGLEPFLAGLRSYFDRARVGQRHARRPARRAGGGLGPRPVRLGRAVAARPPGSTRCGPRSTSTTTARSPASRSCRAAPGRAQASCARTGSPSGSTTTIETGRLRAHPPGRGRRRRASAPPVPELLGVSRGKLVLVNDDDLTYCALRLDPGSLATLIDRIGDIAEPLPRTLCWSAAWDMTRDAELKARDFAALVAGGLRRRDRDRRACSGCCCRPRRPCASYADPEWAAERGWPLLVDALRFRLDTALPGSDAQLAVVNSLAGSVLPRVGARRASGAGCWTSTCRRG